MKLKKVSLIFFFFFFIVHISLLANGFDIQVVGKIQVVAVPICLENEPRIGHSMDKKNFCNHFCMIILTQCYYDNPVYPID